jgi:DNA modification methylase
MTELNIQIINADVLDVDPADYLPSHYLLSDPPYGIKIMGEKWDSDIALKVATWEHIRRFLDKGAMTTVYSQPKTVFQMGHAMESAGFESHGLIGWLHLSGFCSPARVTDKDDTESPWFDYRYGSDSLRPLFEPVIIAQNPFDKGNKRIQILDGNLGAYNIAESRLPNGKHPPNIIASHHPDCTNDKGCSPHCPSRAIVGKNGSDYFNVFRWAYNELETLFYSKKPSTWEKEAGLEDFDYQTMQRVNSGGFSKDKKFEPKQRKNPHRTVKPIEAGKYLAKLFQPPQDEKNTIFIPFCGTGSEIIGAMLAGWKNIIAIELDSGYAAIAQARVDFWKSRVNMGWDSVVKVVADLKKDYSNQSALF